jgi:hypothetical protein
MRVGAKDVLIHFSPVMKGFILPKVSDVVEGLKKILNR